MKHLTSTQRWFGPLSISVLLILALLQLAACDNANNGSTTGSNNSTNNGNSSSTNNGNSSSTNNGSSNSNQRSLNTNSGGGGPCNNYQITVQQASSATWDVTMNSIKACGSYNGHTPNVGNHFLIVDASFTNTSSGAQTLGPDLFVVKDDNGQQYSEDQASNPGQTFTVEPNQNLEIQAAYEVPDSGCNFTLTFVDNSNSNSLQWPISCG